MKRISTLQFASFFLCLLLPSLLLAQTVGEFVSLVTKSGQVYEGRVRKVEPEVALTVEQADGTEVRILYSNLKYPPQTAAPADVDTTGRARRSTAEPTAGPTVERLPTGTSRPKPGERIIGLAFHPQIGLGVDFVDAYYLARLTRYQGPFTSPLRIQPNLITGFYIRDIFLMGVGLGLDIGWYNRGTGDSTLRRLPDRRISFPITFRIQVRYKDGPLNPYWHADIGYQAFGVPGFLLGTGSGLDFKIANGVSISFEGGIRAILGSDDRRFDTLRGLQAYVKLGVPIRR